MKIGKMITHACKKSLGKRKNKTGDNSALTKQAMEFEYMNAKQLFYKCFVINK